MYVSLAFLLLPHMIGLRYVERCHQFAVDNVIDVLILKITTVHF